MNQDQPIPYNKTPPADPTDAVVLSDEQRKSVLKTASASTILTSIPGLGKLFELADKTDQEMRQLKLAILLNGFQSELKSVELAMKRIEVLMSSRAGVILFQKILHILDDGVLDEEWLQVLAKVLKNISQSESQFNEQFEEKSYVLAQIARITPQALLIIAKYDQWRDVRIEGATHMSHQTIVGNWDNQVMTFLTGKMGITDGLTKARISHSFRELEGAGMIHLTSPSNLQLTSIGNEIFRFVS